MPNTSGMLQEMQEGLRYLLCNFSQIAVPNNIKDPVCLLPVGPLLYVLQKYLNVVFSKHQTAVCWRTGACLVETESFFSPKQKVKT